MKNNSVCVVGLDGATWKVLDPLIKKNELPFLKSIISKSAYGTLVSPIPSLSAPSWASFMTGVNPGKHSIYDFIDYRKGKGKAKINSSKDIKAPKIWDVLGESSVKSLIINLPLTYPLHKMNGVMVSSFLTPKNADYVYPTKYQKLLDVIEYELDILTDKKLGVFPSKTMSGKIRKIYLDKLTKISQKRLKAYKLLYELDDFSFSFVLFKETDIAQHMFWGSKELSKYYQELDKILRELHDYVKSKSNRVSFVLMSDHGFHKAPIWEFSVYSWLVKEISSPLVKSESGWDLISSVNKRIKDLGLTPTSMSMVKRIRGEILKEAKVSFAEKNGFLVSSHGLYNYGGLNSKSEINNIVRKLSKEIYHGKKVFKLVKVSKDVYKGKYVSYSPDIVWETNSEFIVDTNIYTKNTYKKRVNILKGEHGSDNKGIYIVKGDNIKVGKDDVIQMYDMNTLLIKIMGITIPWYSDGVIPDFFNERIDTKQKYFVEKKITDEIKNLKI